MEVAHEVIDCARDVIQFQTARSQISSMPKSKLAGEQEGVILENDWRLGLVVQRSFLMNPSRHFLSGCGRGPVVLGPWFY